MTKLSVVIPAYNEENGIAEIMNRTLAVREALRVAGVEEFELLVVNDGSRDRTREAHDGPLEVVDLAGQDVSRPGGRSLIGPGTVEHACRFIGFCEEAEMIGCREVSPLGEELAAGALRIVLQELDVMEQLLLRGVALPAARILSLAVRQ